MSKSARERDNPPPRRKSCSVCIRAKRRCEYVVGLACLRCTQRNITCDYPSHRKPPQQQQEQRRASTQRVDSMQSALAEDRSFLCAATDMTAAVDFSYAAINSFDTFLNEPLMTGSGAIPAAEAGMGKNEAQLALADIDMTADMGVSLDLGLYGMVPPLLGETGSGADISSVNSYAEGPDIDGGLHTQGDAGPQTNLSQTPALASTTLIDPMARDFTFISTTLQQRLEYAIGVFRAAPRTMVHDLETPWSHPMLYQNGMPKCMQDALSSCALYLSKTKINTPIIFTLMDAHVRELLAAPPPTTLPLALAHTHALLLYQIMRLFDGDIAARARGELLITTLEDATMRVHSFLHSNGELLSAVLHQNNNDGNEPARQQHGNDPLHHVRDLWHHWLLHESARRTVLIAFYMLQAYRAMVTPNNAKAKCAALSHSWTLCRGLWKAQSVLEFARAWSEGRWHIMTNRRFKDALQEVKAEDVDDFGKMWITALMGVEESEWWFAARGGSLREETVIGPALVS